VNERIFLSAPDVREHEREYVMAAIDSNWIAPAGPDLEAFEVELSVATDRQFAVGLSSGTAALHLALLGVGVGPGDEVICSSLTFAGSANPIVYCGAAPIFIDCESTSWNMDPALLADELEERAAAGALPAAAIVVDLYGNCANYDDIVPLLDRYEIPLIEDAAEAVGSTYRNRKAGSFGRHGILSFNGNKIITSSGGGAFVTDNEDSANRVRYLSTQARQSAVHYEHTEIGYNYRMSNICAALGRAQLKTLGDRIARRREINEVYVRAFEGIEGCEVLTPPQGSTSNYWLSCATLNPDAAPLTSRELMKSLEAGNIESRPVWKPMHLQPVFSGATSRTNGCSEALFTNGICLPSGSGMSDAAIERVVAVLNAELRMA